MPNAAIIRAIQRAIEQLPERENIRSVKLFGSFARGEETEGSDVDLIVTFIRPVTLLDMVSLKREMETTLDRGVDVVTPEALSKYFREPVLAAAVTVYGS